MNFSRTRPSRRLGIFCLIVIAHGAGVLLWPSLTARTPPSQRDPATSTLWLLPTPERVTTSQRSRPAPTASSVAVRNNRQPSTARTQPAPAASLIAAPAAPLPDTVAPLAATSSASNPDKAATSHVPLRDLLLAEFKRDGGKIDRESRRNSVNPAERTPELKGTAIARGIAAAYIDRAPARQEEIVLDDGTRVTRIGNTCYMKDNGGRTRGMDHISRGTPTVARECWQAGLPMR